MLFPLNGKLDFGKAVFETSTLACHYAWLLAAAFTYLSPAKVRGVSLTARHGSAGF